ncbi:response regulator [Hyphomicrobium sp. 2TAF46]|uniref:response regulator n=1 Tax=Hyphomicrobium sp. 2TAF46 TaxID=3233019 RepID=UPI003F8E86DF
MNALILIVEDEAEIAEILDAYFTREGFRTVRAGDGQTALDLHLRLKPDLVILDVKLPKLDGYEVLAAIRRRDDTPVLMATALAEDIDKLQALRIGADDYVVKPFNPLEVVARTRAILRRTRAHVGATVIRAGKIEIDLTAHAAIVISEDGVRRKLDLTLTEFRLLAHMSRASNRAFTRAELVDACLPEGEAMERTVDSHISNVRRKLESATATGYLEGVRGVGYRLVPLA